MKITIESTEELVKLDTGKGMVPGRIWKGKTESGIEVFCVVTRIGIAPGADGEQFERELQECPDTRLQYDPQAIPLRMIL